MGAEHWRDWVAPDHLPPHIEPLFGPSCKPFAQLDCDDVHHGPIPDHSILMCMCRHCCSRQIAAQIKRSYAPEPIDPEDDEYGPKATSYKPDDKLKGGIG